MGAFGATDTEDDGATMRPVSGKCRRALLIGNGTYEDHRIPDIPGPLKDIAALETVLGDPETGGFEITTLVDRGFLEVRREIARVSEDCQPGDDLLIYYSGMGFRDLHGQRLYLPASDTDYSIGYATALDCDFLLAAFGRSQAKCKLFILDCCHAGAFFEGNRGVPSGFAVLASCGADHICSDGPDGGVFTQALVDGLVSNKADRDRDGRVSVDEMFDYIRNRFADDPDTPEPQRWICDLPESFYLTEKAHPVFISYSRSNSEFVRKLFDSLQAKNIPAWLEVEGVRGGEDWVAGLVHNIKTARYVAAVVSAESLKSKWCRRELELADKYSISILPIVVGDVDLPGWFEFQFSDRQRVDWDPQSQESTKKVVNRLVQFYSLSPT